MLKNFKSNLLIRVWLHGERPPGTNQQAVKSLRVGNRLRSPESFLTIVIERDVRISLSGTDCYPSSSVPANFAGFGLHYRQCWQTMPLSRRNEAVLYVKEGCSSPVNERTLSDKRLHLLKVTIITFSCRPRVAIF